MTYLEYIQSPTWKLLRRQRLCMDNHECVLCGSPADNVHHRRYPDRLGDETVMDLVSLCRECHAKFHGVGVSDDVLPKPTPPTAEMGSVLDGMKAAEEIGDADRSGRLLSLYVNMRRAQVVG